MYSPSRDSVGEGREKGCLVDCRRVGGGEGKGENGIRMVDDGVRKRYEGVEGVKEK